MRNEEFWLSVHTDEDPNGRLRATGALRMAVAFGIVAIAASVILPPYLTGGTVRYAGSDAGIDTMSTGSITPRAAREYTLRQSVLQQQPGAVCIVDISGRGRGDC
jgi:hypothetical protein